MMQLEENYSVTLSLDDSNDYISSALKSYATVLTCLIISYMLTLPHVYSHFLFPPCQHKKLVKSSANDVSN